MKNIFVLLILASCTCAAQDIEKPRVIQIQRALRKAGHHVAINGLLIGDTYDALKGVAAEHHWQTESVPDSRVLITLGLGPKYKLLNPDTAAVWHAEEQQRMLIASVKH